MDVINRYTPGVAALTVSGSTLAAASMEIGFR